ncbi:hypothetical protein CC78DRAFT_450258, partial [Lojkania enalia]
KLLSTGRFRYIEVLNFSSNQLKNLATNSNIRPVVHPMELHPYLQQSKWIDVHFKHEIAIVAYSPLGNMNPTYSYRRDTETCSKAPLLLENEIVAKTNEKRRCTSMQVALA